MSEILKPCPFCGRQVKIEAYGDGFMGASCSCDLEPHTGSLLSKEEVIEMWNTRPMQLGRPKRYLLDREGSAIEHPEGFWIQFSEFEAYATAKVAELAASVEVRLLYLGEVDEYKIALARAHETFGYESDQRAKEITALQAENAKMKAEIEGKDIKPG